MWIVLEVDLVPRQSNLRLPMTQAVGQIACKLEALDLSALFELFWVVSVWCAHPCTVRLIFGIPPFDPEPRLAG